MTNHRDTEGAGRSHDGQLAATKRSDAAWRGILEQTPTQRRNDGLVMEVKTQLLADPLPDPTNPVEVAEWCDRRARNIVTGVLGSLGAL